MNLSIYNNYFLQDMELFPEINSKINLSVGLSPELKPKFKGNKPFALLKDTHVFRV